jgi:myo-inositol-1-phosphate synthase
LFGALGGLATTVVVGARAIARGKAAAQGMLTATPLFDGVPLCGVESLVFGGHDVRPGDWAESAAEIQRLNGTLPWPLLQELGPELKRLSKQVSRGVLTNAGPTITGLAPAAKADARPLAEQVERIEADLRAFQKRNRLDRVVCVNLTSTEPPLALGPAHANAAAFARAIDEDRRDQVRPSALYAWAAAGLGLPFVHFTPSNATLSPGVRERFAQQQAPYTGCDGKTGETLVKSALAPMFKYRNLRVLSWQGYNILGDRDGRVLADRDNKRAKVESKDALLPSILGYPLHTHVGIDYVPSLHDLKTAWDFVHFEGFLGHRMALQFIWQGCDSILAAPLVLDLVRLVELAARSGEQGALPHLACFFKRPIGADQHDLHEQWHLLVDYAAKARARAPAARKTGKKPAPRRRRA